MHIVQISVLVFSLLLVSQPGKKKNDLLAGRSAASAKVVAVLAGDVIAVKLDEEIMSVRLAEVDSPEQKQPLWRQAKEFIHDLAMGKKVTLIIKMVDRHKRIVAEVILPDGRSLNQEVIKWGYAWHYKVNPNPSKILSDLEYHAWQKKLGIWIEAEPVPPWKFRRGMSAPEPPSNPDDVDYDQIFNYGLIGDPETKLYNWPACRNYKIMPREDRVIFSSKLGAEDLGYQAEKGCPGK